MSNATTTASPAQATPRRRWRVRTAAMFLALAGIALVGLWLYADYSLNNAWNEAESEADRLDPRWRLAEIEADRAVIPDEKNAALVIGAIAREADKKTLFMAADHAAIFAKYPPPARMNAAQVAQVRGELALVPKPLLEQAHQLHRLQKGRFAYQYTDDYYTTSKIEVHGARHAAFWLLHEGSLCIEEEKYGDALKACDTVLNIGHAIGFQPDWISFATRHTMQLEALYTLERILAHGEIRDESLQAMQLRIEKDIAESSWLNAVRGERAGGHHFFTNVRNGRISDVGRTILTSPTPNSFSEWIIYLVPSTAAKHYPETLHYMNGTIEVAKLPIHERLAKIQEREAERRKIKTAANRFVPSLQKLHRYEAGGQALLRSAQATLACERYRLKHDEWPATLDALVQAKLLAAVPADPIDNQPLRYRQTKDGIVIYSLARNEKDDGGTIDRTDATGPDIGFRLWNTNERRQPAIEAPEAK